MLFVAVLGLAFVAWVAAKRAGALGAAVAFVLLCDCALAILQGLHP